VSRGPRVPALLLHKSLPPRSLPPRSLPLAQKGAKRGKRAKREKERKRERDKEKRKKKLSDLKGVLMHLLESIY